jgi:hypothetical protein
VKPGRIRQRNPNTTGREARAQRAKPGSAGFQPAYRLLVAAVLQISIVVAEEVRVEQNFVQKRAHDHGHEDYENDERIASKVKDVHRLSDHFHDEDPAICCGQDQV